MNAIAALMKPVSYDHPLRHKFKAVATKLAFLKSITPKKVKPSWVAEPEPEPEPELEPGP